MFSYLFDQQIWWLTKSVLVYKGMPLGRSIASESKFWYIFLMSDPDKDWS